MKPHLGIPPSEVDQIVKHEEYEFVLFRLPITSSLQLSYCSRGSLTVVLDGVFYNRKDLCGLLLDFDSKAVDSDASLFLALYEEFGLEALTSINGPFAFALWNDALQNLTLGRDRFGLKTCYWAAGSKGIIAGSGMFPVARAYGEGLHLNYASGLDYLVNGFTDQTSETLLEGVHQLEPGTTITWNAIQLRNGHLFGQPKTWYQLRNQGTLDLEADHAAEEFRRLLRDSVELRWSPEKSGALLFSSGLDSTSIACLISSHVTRRPLRTFKACFQEAQHDEMDLTFEVLESIGAEHTNYTVQPTDLFSLRNPLLAAIEVPYERSIIAAHWALCREISKDGITYTLDGIGADEQLGGYQVWLDNYDALYEGRKVPGLAYISTSRPKELSNESVVSALYAGLSSRWKSWILDTVQAGQEVWIDSFGELCQYHIRKGALPMLLRYNRDIAGAFGQHARSPFLDHRLVEFSIGLGSHHKVVDGQSKYVLRSAMADIVPSRLLTRHRKLSHSNIEAKWLGGVCFEQLASEARRTVAEWTDLFDEKQVEEFLHERTNKISLFRLWRITCFGAWLRDLGVSV